MKSIIFGVLIIAFLASCNDSATGSHPADSPAAKDNTNMYDTAAAQNMSDTTRHGDNGDTSLIPNKMQDTGMKK